MTVRVGSGYSSFISEPLGGDGSDGTVTTFWPTGNPGETTAVTVFVTDLPHHFPPSADGHLYATEDLSAPEWAHLGESYGISLLSPSQLEFDTIIWRFRMSYAWEGRTLQDIGTYSYRTHDYSYVFIPWHYDYLSAEDIAKGWTYFTVEQGTESLTISAGIGDVDDADRAYWTLTMEGGGKAHLSATGGGQSSQFDVRANRWYTLTAHLGADSTSYALTDGDTVLGSVSGQAIELLEESHIVVTGDLVTSASFQVDFDEITFGPTKEGQGEITMWVTHAIYDVWSPFEGLVPANPEGSSGVVTRIASDGTRHSWMLMGDDDDAYWTEPVAIQCDETGVYVMAMGGPSPYSDLTSGSIFRKFDLDDNLVWSRFFPNPNDYLVFGLSDGVIVIDTGLGGGQDDSWAIDASDGTDIWNGPGYGFAEGGVIRGPDVDGSPTLWTIDTDAGNDQQHLALLGASGIIGDWVIDTHAPDGLFGIFTLLPTSDPTVFYGWDTSSASTEYLWRIEADGVNQPVVTDSGIHFSEIDDEISIGASMDPDNHAVFTHAPWNFATNDPLRIRGIESNGSVRWGPTMLSNQHDFNGIFGNSRAHDGLYMQVAYWGLYGSSFAPQDYGAAVTMFDQATGNIVFGPYIYGDNEPGGELNGCFLAATAPVVEDVPDGVSPGWNQNIAAVIDGQFTIEGTPSPGTLTVFDGDGVLLHHPQDYEEADDVGLVYDIHTDATTVHAVFYVADPILETHTSVPRPSEKREMEDQSRGPWTAMS